MPFLQIDPWSKQFFDRHDCPDDLEIPTKDSDAFRLNPEHNWAYNKLLIAERQGLRCAPHGIAPDHYPVFSKPIYNLRSMGLGSGVLHSFDEYEQALTPGFFWVELHEGEHFSTDVAVVEGTPRWFSFTKGYPLPGGTFDYWELLAGDHPSLRAYLGAFIEANFPGYTGMMNFETIDGRIIEMHLRFARQWTDLYGEAFVPALMALYGDNHWPGDVEIASTGYSVIVFGPVRQYRKPSAAFAADVIQETGISSLQFPFTEGKAPELHSMPPGGFRTAVINGFDRAQAMRARELITAEIDRISD